MPTYRLTLAYDGSGFHGYARQPEVRTVQGDLEAALFRHTGPVDTYVAGRTDKGVHATAQVVSFTSDELDTARVQRSLNAMLAPSIAVLAIDEVDDDFHARFSASGRAYRYRIHNSAVHDPFRDVVMWTYGPELDATAMDVAVRGLVGKHDFAAFCRRHGGSSSTTRRVLWAGWRRSSDVVEMAIGAQSFCHQMVRSIVAVSAEIGRGRRPSSEMEQILESRDRSTAHGAAPAAGLTLVAVSYGDQELPRPGWIAERWDAGTE